MVLYIFDTDELLPNQVISFWFVLLKNLPYLLAIEFQISSWSYFGLSNIKCKVVFKINIRATFSSCLLLNSRGLLVSSANLNPHCVISPSDNTSQGACWGWKEDLSQNLLLLKHPWILFPSYRWPTSQHTSQMPNMWCWWQEVLAQSSKDIMLEMEVLSLKWYHMKK